MTGGGQKKGDGTSPRPIPTSGTELLTGSAESLTFRFPFYKTLPHFRRYGRVENLL